MSPTPTDQDQRKLVPLEKILTYDRSLQVRGEILQAKVERYAELMRENGTDGALGYMDPIMVFYETDDGPRWIADGFHRIESAQKVGAIKMPVILRQGSKSKALRFGLGENGHHGFPMTNKEKRCAAALAVVDPEIGKLADGKIAALIGCSPSLVSDARRGETPAAKATKRTEKKALVETSTEGNRETESLAPKSATARERTPVDNQPTKAQILRAIQDYLANDCIDEADLTKLMEGPDAEYRWCGKPGTVVGLKIIGKSGRVQTECEVVVKEIGLSSLILKYEGGGKIAIQEG